MKKPNLQILLKNIDSSVTKHMVLRTSTYREGTLATVKIQGRKEYFALPKGYHIQEMDGIPTIGGKEGEVIAVPLFGDSFPDTPGEEYALLLRTHLKAEHTKTLKGKAEIPWKWIIVTLGVVVIVIVGFMIWQQSQPKPVNSGNQPTATGNVQPLGGGK